MVDIAQFKKTLFQQYKSMMGIGFDVLVCMFLAIPILWHEAFKMLFPRRKNVRGKLALVSGGGGGLGRCISLQLAELGCHVAVVDIDGDAADAVAKELKMKGVDAKGFKADISEADDIKKLRDDIKSDMGTVDILINNAGVIPNMANDVTTVSLEAMLRVNILGTIMMTRCFVDQMKLNNGGHIVAISSMSGLHASPFAVDYSASKAAVNSFMSGLTEKLRIEHSGKRFRTTCVCPFYITTRKDIVEFLNPDIRFAPLEVEATAREIVDGILQEKYFFTVPAHFGTTSKILNIFPLRVQQLFRDRVLKEYQFKSSSSK